MAYLDQLAPASRHDTPTPTTVRTLDDLLASRDSFVIHDDSPVLGRRTSLEHNPVDDYYRSPINNHDEQHTRYDTEEDEDDAKPLGLAYASLPTVLRSTSARARPLPPSTVLQPRQHAQPPQGGSEDPHQYHLPRSYSARDVPHSPDSPMLLRSVSDASARPRPRLPASPPPALPTNIAAYRSTSGGAVKPAGYAATQASDAAGTTDHTSPYPESYPPPKLRDPSSGSNMTPPISLFSEGSSSASTRSSLAFNSPQSALGHTNTYDTISDDYRRAPPHATMDRFDTSFETELPNDGPDAHYANVGDVGVALTSDLTHSSSISSFASSSRARVTDPSRWSGSSFGRPINPSDGLATIRNQGSFDWDTVDERDEYELTTTDDETDADDEVDEDDYDIEGDRTAAIMVVEEGKGMIVHGEGLAVDKLTTRSGTTHLLVASSATPNQMPAFLSQALPSICSTLLALDISCNLLPALPPALVSCTVLEELNIGANPLRVLPIWLSELTSLRVLIADSTGISNVPAALHTLKALHTLSLRRNRLYSLPAWLCHLSALETLLIEGNPFQEPWTSLVAPLMAPVPLTPAYPPNTPQVFSPAMSTAGTEESEAGDNYQAQQQQQMMSSLDTSLTDQPSSLRRSISSPQQFPSRNNYNSYSVYSQASRPPSAYQTPVVPEGYAEEEYIPSSPPTRTRAEPSISTVRPKTATSASLVGSYLAAIDPSLSGSSESPPPPPKGDYSVTGSARSIVRRMKSADELSRLTTNTITPGTSMSPPSQNSIEERAMSPPTLEAPLPSRRFESLPRGRGNGAVPSEQVVGPRARIPVFEEDGEQQRSRPSSRSIHGRPSMSPEDDRHHGERSGKKWGFLKKMSMGRMRSGSTAARHDRHIDKDVTPTPSRILATPSQAQRPYSAAGDAMDGKPLSPPRPLRPDGLAHAQSDSSVPMALSASHGATNAGPLNLPVFAPLAPLPPIELPSLSIAEDDFTADTPSRPPMPSPAPSRADGAPSLRVKPSREVLTVPQHSVSLSPNLLTPSPSPTGSNSLPVPRASRRRSFLPINFATSPTLELPMPLSPSMLFQADGATTPVSENPSRAETPAGDEEQFATVRHSQAESTMSSQIEDEEEVRHREMYGRALRSVIAYLRDLSDLSGPIEASVPMTPATTTAASSVASGPNSPTSGLVEDRKRRPTLGSEMHSDASQSSSQAPSITSQLQKKASSASLRQGALSVSTTDSGVSSDHAHERVYKEDRIKRVKIVQEIYATERTYVGQLQELVDIYVAPASAIVTNTFGGSGSKETIIPSTERKIVFNGIESLLAFHHKTLLPSLEKAIAPLRDGADDEAGELSGMVAYQVAMAFVSHAAFMKMYTTYINNFDNCVARVKKWVDKSTPAPSNNAPSGGGSGANSIVGLGLSMSAVAGVAPEPVPGNLVQLSSSQKKRIKSFLKRCRMSPRHSQLNLEGYLLLPVQRVPRYRLLLEELVRCTPPKNAAFDDPIEHALNIISSLATNMNESKRETEARRKLIHWQSRIRGRFPSPLVQPHRRLIMDGHLHLTRVVRKSATFAEVWKADGEKTLVQVECLAPEMTPRPLIALLCNDLLVLCKDPSQGKDPNSHFDLWAVLRMQTTAQPASVVHGSSLRLVDNKAILYFDAPSMSEALTWSRAINLHIPASR